ncbi:hypothetical protein TBR22_A49300 [Luteitalea sp. TBR-22]|uniref:hypothetical protein n=1 Tax=Luteitalea sp. TBR-22 TaxID=2802971 RepID=UPI001AF4AAAF|nr:hypothetical protein [Luteitalea sp. TBR-22]BCS35696.1 hypothetical protein TBR22_A49300 [Luteitalea sp. TBR-22]
MSPLLILGVLLLVIVGVLSLLQRRTQVDHTTRGGTPPVGPPQAPEPAGPRRVRNETQLEDPRLGVLVFNDDRLWQTDSLDFDGIPIVAELQGDAQGLHPAARRIAVAACDDAKRLWARGRELVAAELQRRGQPTDDIEPYELAVDVEDGEPVGFLWYVAGDFRGEIGVSSRDQWQTLSLEVIE